jgi:hypothetical protein
MDYAPLIANWAVLSSTTTDGKIAEINALVVAGPDRLVPIVEVMDYLRSNNLWLPIKAAQATSPGAAAAVDLNEDQRIVTMDFNLPIVGSMLADLVGRGLLTQAQSAALVALKGTTMPWWQSAGYPMPIGRGFLINAGLITQ